jgi:serine phosphatase RsbU (regulator of sigma subunit)
VRIRQPWELRRFWQTLPFSAYAMALATVFLLFSTIGFSNDVFSGGRYPTLHLTLAVLVSGLLAVAIFLTITKSLKFLPLALAFLILSLALPTFSSRFDALRLLKPQEIASGTPSGRQRRITNDVAGIQLAVMAAYGFFIRFIATEGRRYVRIYTEIALARSLHQVVAPPVNRRLGRFEIVGASLPSNEVGGDLVDVVETKDMWLAYIADVSGHGVASGTLMAMFKSAMRSRLMRTVDLQALVTDVNRVIFDLKNPSMFITCACLTYSEGDAMEVVLAGHLPVLHYRQETGSLEELSVPNLPVGMFEQPTYETGRVRFGSGDLFALVTDGLTEVFDRRGNEFGFDRLKSVIAGNVHRPLPELLDAVIADVRRYGKQSDDQSLLLVRCL